MALNEAVSGQIFLRRIRQFLSSRRNRTYILPTRFGLAFATMSLVLFFLAVGYGNNLIFIFFFSLISIAMTSAIVTNRNIQAVQFLDFSCEALFAKEKGQAQLKIKNKSKNNLYDLQVFFKGSKNISLKNILQQQSESLILIDFVPLKRGWNEVSPIRLQSPHPFSLFCAWTIYKPDHLVLIYPERKGNEEFPLSAAEAADASNAGLFLEHRKFQSTDSVRRIDWRASARRQDLFVKNYEDSEKPQLAFNWAQTSDIEDFEMRISQLALWIDRSHRLGHSYSLDLGFKKFGPRHGKDHWKECLEALALLEAKDLL